MSKILLTCSWLLMVFNGLTQTTDFKKGLQGKYIYGNLDPIYLANDDGSIDSSFAQCNYGELDVYYANDSLFFEVDVCNATYHIGHVAGHIELNNSQKGVFKYEESGDDIMNCWLEFRINGDTIHIDEKKCNAWHGARAWFTGSYVQTADHELSLIYEKERIESLTEEFFRYFNAFDSKALKKMVHEDCELESYALTENGWINGEGDMAALYHMLDQKYPIEEKIGNIEVTTNGVFATSWMDYSFYVKDDIDHCGKNYMFWKKIDGEWKITSLKDDVRKVGCEEYSTKGEHEKPVETYLSKEVNLVMNNWHKGAADANAEVYFGLMADDCIYLGTDPGERWTKDEFVSFAKPYFDKGQAWAFTTNWRHVYFSKDFEYAWFEESLDTHMGECRGSGVLERIDGKWLIKQYNLTVTILNEQMDDFRVLTGVKK